MLYSNLKSLLSLIFIVIMPLISHATPALEQKESPHFFDSIQNREARYTGCAREKLSQTRYNLTAVAIFQNEAPYLKEWIEYHQLLGVEYFLLYDNLSTDNYLEVLAEYIAKGTVDLIEWPFTYTDLSEWNPLQCRAYDDAITKLSGVTKWAIFIDPDEFIVPKNSDRLDTWLEDYEAFPAVTINWQLFGTSHVEKIPADRLLIESLTFKSVEDASANIHVKSIVRPETVEVCTNPHHFKYKHGGIQVTSHKQVFSGPFSPTVQTDLIQINHYTIRDEFYLHHVKIPRREKWGLEVVEWEKQLEPLNALSDDAILRFVPALRERMGFGS